MHHIIELELHLISPEPENYQLLRFTWEISQTQSDRIWILRLPPILNPEAVPSQSAIHCHELKLFVLNQADFLHLSSFPYAPADPWLQAQFAHDARLPATLLLTIRGDQLVTILYQP